ncbi:MAG: Trans-aconitate 2-methyltransferase [Lentisphaerae bacterium ADurb.Bin242]|nr:MAG: Trans-aconitate 2-methyltransferase [Lentisphaerae bacterium ADurb.Bin242]
MPGKYIDCLRLNGHMLRHLLRGRVLRPEDFSLSYDALSSRYNASWLTHLAPVTDRMLALLPKTGPDSVLLDLGCGSGHTTAFLEEHCPDARITAVDISRGMLNEAVKICSRSRFECADMLEYLRRVPAESVDLIVSAWALGYSHPTKLFREVRRVLTPGGILLFVTNLATTLAPVFHAYRRTLARYPERTLGAIFHHFPPDAGFLHRLLEKNWFRMDFFEEGRIGVTPPEDVPLAEWLLSTGILAGFDRILPLASDPEVAAYFTGEVRNSGLPLAHRYVMAKGIKL